MDVREAKGLSMQHTTPVTAPMGDTGLFDSAFDVPATDGLSWYQRNSGSLPKSEGGMGDVQRRSQLPSPTAPDPVSLMERLRGLMRR